MHIRKEVKAVSTFFAILLILVSLIFGALISYMWTMAPFYREPDTVNLAVTDVNFPVNRADYLNFTIMNPSHSPSGTNITNIYLTVEGESTTINIASSFPNLPFPLDRGMTKTVECFTNWGQYAGKTITVHVSSVNASGASRSAKTEFVRLEVDAYFNATESSEYFNATVTNNHSAINLTLSRIWLDSDPIENRTIGFPRVIQPNETIKFDCFINWQTHGRPVVKAETTEGYSAQIGKEAPSVVDLQVTDVTFSETDSNKVNITLSNFPESGTLVDITSIGLAHGNITDFITGNLSSPSLPFMLNISNAVTFDCTWNWGSQAYRNMDINITVYTKQGFTSQNRTVTTPAEVAGKIADVEFDLDDTNQFSVNVTNLPYSLQTINVTRIDLNQNTANMTSALVATGEQATFACSSNWTGLLRQNVTITAYIAFGANGTATLTQNVTVPYVKIRDASFTDSEFGTHTVVNITIYNSAFSTLNATVTQIFIKTQNKTQPLDGTIARPAISPQGYELTIGTEATISCYWNWGAYVGEEITVIVQTADGLQASTTLVV